MGGGLLSGSLWHWDIYLSVTHSHLQAVCVVTQLLLGSLLGQTFNGTVLWQKVTCDRAMVTSSTAWQVRPPCDQRQGPRWR
jgi:hypothetical protein